MLAGLALRADRQLRVGDKVVTVDIVLVAVSVVIDAVLTVQLGLVDPHVGSQVGMVPLHAVIDNGHDHARITRAETPGVLAVDIRTGLDLRVDLFVARVDVVPLLAQLGIVERHAGGRHVGAGGGSREALVERNDFRVVDAGEFLIELYLAYFGDPGHLQSRLVEIGLLIEFHEIPAVQTCRTGAFFVPLVHREETSERLDADVVEYGVEIGDARTGGHAARTRHAQDGVFDIRDGIAVEVDQQLAFGSVRRREYKLGSNLVFHLDGSRLSGRVFRTRCKEKHCQHER